ncbi:hypothetical protein J4474_01325 [Candidatus Pacearchaeota archaeon]|nr:hypothetical protein [Candidatus Pacearchaeota archaeon]
MSLQKLLSQINVVDENSGNLIELIQGEKLSELIKNKVKGFEWTDSPSYRSGHVISEDETFERVFLYISDKLKIPRENIFEINNREKYKYNEASHAEEIQYREDLPSGNYILKVLGFEKMILYLTGHGYDQTLVESIRIDTSGRDKLLQENSKPKNPKKILVVSHTNLSRMNESQSMRAYNEILRSQFSLFRFFFDRPKTGREMKRYELTLDDEIVSNSFEECKEGEAK